MNYRIEASTPSGTVNLVVFEQSWTKTLELSQATLAIPPAGASLAITTVPLIDSPLQLDANAFALYKLKCGPTARSVIKRFRAAQLRERVCVGWGVRLLRMLH